MSDKGKGFLDKTFNSFFPRSQTVSKGIFLYRLAWAIEITIALIGASIGLLIMRQSQGYDELDQSLMQNISLDDFMMGMIFMIVAIVEITKIPLAAAVYYSRKTMWTVTFLFALIAVNVSTFETIVTGFERINNNRTSDIKKLIIKKTTLEQQLAKKNVAVADDNLALQINQKNLENQELQKQILAYEEQAQKDRTRILDQSDNKSEIDALRESNKIDEDRSRRLQESIDKTSDQISKQKGLFTSRRVLTDKLKTDQASLQSINVKISERIKEIGRLENLALNDSKDQINFINNQLQSQTKSLRFQFEENLKLIAQLTKSQQVEVKDKFQDREDIKNIKEEINKTIDEIDRLGPLNQVYRVATWFKGWFLIDYEMENRRIEKDILALERSKFKEKVFIFFEKDQIISSEQSKQIDNKISDLKIQIIENNEKLEVQRNTIGSQSAYSNLPEEALTFAFWIWFGVLSFIISITGTLLAFAALNLQDPRLHEDLNKPNTGLGGATYRFSKLLSAFRRYLLNRVKYFLKPKPEKIIEVEKIVEKPVEKIVEKPVVEEKIVEKIVEVPVEVKKVEQVEKKVFVHVPLPTDDPDLLKKGPFIYNEKNKDKK